MLEPAPVRRRSCRLAGVAEDLQGSAAAGSAVCTPPAPLQQHICTLERSHKGDIRPLRPLHQRRAPTCTLTALQTIGI